MAKNSNGLFEVRVDGELYEFEKWGAEEALDTLIDLSSMVGKPIGMAVAAMFSKDGLTKEIDPDLMGKIFEALLQNCNKEKTKPIIKKLCCDKVFCEGKKISFDHHYQDRLMHCFKVVKASLEVQYGSFFEELLGLTKLRGALK